MLLIFIFGLFLEHLLQLFVTLRPVGITIDFLASLVVRHLKVLVHNGVLVNRERLFSLHLVLLLLGLKHVFIVMPVFLGKLNILLLYGVHSELI